MAFSRAQKLWRYLQPEAEERSVGPRLDAVDQALRTRLNEVRADIVLARATMTVLADRIQALDDGKAPVVHTHQPNQIVGLVNTINNLQARIAALEAKVP